MEGLSQAEIMERVVEGLKKLREENNLSQRDVMHDTGIHIARIEGGQRTITIDTLHRICHYFKMPMHEFLEKYCGQL